MKSLLVILLFAFHFSGYSQSNAYDQLPISYIPAEGDLGVSNSQLNRINGDLLNYITNSGFSSEPYISTPFVLYPIISLGDFKVIETGIDKIFSVSISIDIVIKNHVDGIIFGTTNVNIEGQGISKPQSIDNALNGFKNILNKYVDLRTPKVKIIKYYDENCERLIKESEQLLVSKDFKSAISKLYNIPSQVDCFSKVNSLLKKIILLYDSQICEELLLKAKTFYSGQDYYNCLLTLSNVNPSSGCRDRAELLMSQCEKRINDKELRIWKQHLDDKKRLFDLEKTHLLLTRDIMVEYYRNKPRPITYNMLIVR